MDYLNLKGEPKTTYLFQNPYMPLEEHVSNIISLAGVVPKNALAWMPISSKTVAIELPAQRLAYRDFSKKGCQVERDSIEIRLLKSLVVK
jgi:hypothetical protein